MAKLTGNYKHVQEGLVFKKLVLYVECVCEVWQGDHMVGRSVDTVKWKKANLEDYLQLVKDGVLK